MDHNLVNYIQERYKVINKETIIFMKMISYKPQKMHLSFFPVLLNDILFEKSIHMGWFNGPIFVEAIHKSGKRVKLIDKLLKLSIIAA